MYERQDLQKGILVRVDWYTIIKSMLMSLELSRII